MRQSQHLTDAHSSDMSKKIAQTHPGQPTWAGTGPDGMTCRDCKNWLFDGHYSGGAKAGSLKPGKCTQFKAHGGRVGKAVPHYAKACRLFCEAENARDERPLVQKKFG